ncbi:MAG TPA: Uma2 family endonuclease, partial [Anaerolineae bacterium]|nr:Uma2 family endonuclease [Anaerolineae bacterium]
MEWSQIISDPTLQDLPYKIEQNEWGHIEMSPASNKHSFIQGVLLIMIYQHCQNGRVLPECSIQTAKGVKVAAVVWVSEQFLAEFNTTTPYPRAPELCVEIISPSNSDAEMAHKIDLYLARGAQEVWLCDLNGHLRFHTYDGPHPQST